MVCDFNVLKFLSQFFFYLRPKSNLELINDCSEYRCCQGSVAVVPEQVRLGATEHSSATGEVSVSWVSAPVGHGAAPPCVRYRKAGSGAAFTSVCGVSSTYTDFGWRGAIHRVRVTPPEKRTLYEYMVHNLHKISIIFMFIQLTKAI